MAEPTRANAPDVSHHGLTDERVEQIVGNLLRIGVIGSALVVLAGGMMLLLQESRQPAPDMHQFRQEPDELRSVAGVLRQAGELSSSGVIMLGLLLLIATPVARVLFSVIAFAWQHDYLYVFFTIIVLAVLLYSLFSGYFS
jgi:uncharacterized membrane protein